MVWMGCKEKEKLFISSHLKLALHVNQITMQVDHVQNGLDVLQENKNTLR